MEEILGKDKLIIQVANKFYNAEIFEEDRNTYHAIVCSKCKHEFSTAFNGNLIPDEVVKKINFISDIVVEDKSTLTKSNKLKFIVCEKCSSVHVSSDVIEIIGDSNIIYTFLIDDIEINFSYKLYKELELYFWQTQKEPLEIIADNSYHKKFQEYFEEEQQKEIQELYEKIKLRKGDTHHE